MNNEGRMSQEEEWMKSMSEFGQKNKFELPMIDTWQHGLAKDEVQILDHFIKVKSGEVVNGTVIDYTYREMRVNMWTLCLNCKIL